MKPNRHLRKINFARPFGMSRIVCLSTFKWIWHPAARKKFLKITAWILPITVFVLWYLIRIYTIEERQAEITIRIIPFALLMSKNFSSTSWGGFTELLTNYCSSLSSSSLYPALLSNEGVFAIIMISSLLSALSHKWVLPSVEHHLRHVTPVTVRELSWFFVSS